MEAEEAEPAGEGFLASHSFSLPEASSRPISSYPLALMLLVRKENRPAFWFVGPLVRSESELRSREIKRSVADGWSVSS
jgi:hypothetical protein